MTLRLHDTLSNRKQDFEPLEPGHVRLYTCGPTVWNFAHIGNFRANLFYDLLRRHLLFSGYRVSHVMNLTDVDDKIIEQATLQLKSRQEYVEPYEKAFFEDLATLRAQPAEFYPRASDHIPEMVALIERLLATGHAYAADGDVYFRISSFPGYGKLSHLDRSGLRAGARVATDKYEKESATDFALWKAEQPGDAMIGAAWDAPFGRGRPGWHIECSAMSMRYLGETLDIHCGGIDLCFPHHENEIAQSESATGRQFSRFWLHNAHVQDASGAKMSKSVGNISTLRDLLAAGHDPLALRFFLIAGAHYRSPLRLDDQALHSAGEQVRRLRDFKDRLDRLQPPESASDQDLQDQAAAVRAGYRAALDDDLNLTQGMGLVFDLVRDANAALDRDQVGEAGRAALRQVLAEVDRHLDVLGGGEEALDEEVERLIQEREAARARRDFKASDEIRDRLKEQGIQLEDSKDGVRWRRARS